MRTRGSHGAGADPPLEGTFVATPRGCRERPVGGDRQEYAERHGDTEGIIEPVDMPTFDVAAPVATIQTALADQGAVVVRNAVGHEQLARIRDELIALMTDAPLGDNAFDGFKTRRVFDPLAHTRALDALVLHPVVHELVGRLMQWRYQFGMTILSEVLAGEVAQRLHRDATVYPLPSDFPEAMVNTVWAVDAFTTDNGATLVALRSHLDRETVEVVPAVMPAGSVLIYSGRLLHGAGPNHGTVSRLGFIVEHVARWLRPAECHPIACGAELAASLSAELQELLGFNQTSDFFGFIAGRSPAAWLADQSRT